MTETRGERKERTRRAILDAALDLCEDSSLVALSLRGVAKEVGIVPTAFYRHFDSIEDLGLALVGESLDSLRSVLRDARRLAAGVEEIIDASVGVLIARVRAEEQHFAFIARERYAGPPLVREEIFRGLELFERELATDLAHLPGVSGWSDRDLADFSQLMVTAMVAVAERVIAAPTGPAVDQALAETARRQLLMIVVGSMNWRSTG
ncbi:MAG: TetR family transcriptional regulator [Nocardioides sp.]